MPKKLKSRKFWFALLGALLPQVAAYMSTSVTLEDALQASVAVIIAYIWGQGYVDGKTLETSTDP